MQSTASTITKSTATSFIIHLRNAPYGTLAIASAPIRTPLVGVIRFTMPLAVAYAVTTRSRPTPTKSAIGAIIGIDRAASPDDDGTRNDNKMKKTYESPTKAAEPSERSDSSPK